MKNNNVNYFNFNFPIDDPRIEITKKKLNKFTTNKGRKIVCLPPNIMLDDNLNLNTENVSTIFCGRYEKEYIKKINSIVYSYLDDENFGQKNADYTAESALSLIITKSFLSIYDQKILIIGFGKIGTALTKLFTKLGLKFDIATNSSKLAKTFCNKTIKYEDIELKKYDSIINTAPTTHNFSFAGVRKNQIFIELASNPSIDLNEAQKYFLSAEKYPALPSKDCKESAGLLIAKFISEKLHIVER